MSRILFYIFISCFISRSFSAELIPFRLPWDDSSDSITNVSHLIEKPAGKHGFIRAAGELFVDGEGKPFRILGVNTAFSGNFPSHEQSEKVAARMAKYGINAVRIHHLDTSRSPNGIWKADTEDKQSFDVEKLDRLDYFIAQLKKNGIYTNLNLKVGRKTVAADDVPHADDLPTYDKGPDHFYPRLIELQKNYARDLLTHVNPYTGNDYLKEPAIITIEINNESGLIWQWANRSLDLLPQEYITVLQEDWNAFLKEKYETTVKLKTQWTPQSKGDGKEMLTLDWNAWVFQTLEQAKGTSMPMQQNDNTVLHINIAHKSSESWHVQAFHPGLEIKKGEYYQAKLTLSADPPRTVNIGLQQNHAPWQQLDDPVNIELTAEQKEYLISFSPRETNHNVRLIISGMGSRTGNVTLYKASLKNKAPDVLQPHETLERSTIPVVLRKDYGSKTHDCQLDWMAFLLQRETQYNQEMYDFVKHELGAKPTVTGTQIGFAPFHSQAMHDFIDTHGYFNHPHFPNRQWDAEDWYVENESIVNQKDNVLIRLMERQVAGKPFTVSEYNHPAPMPFASEVIPLAAAYGAFQGWDGIYFFAYSHNNRYEEKSINSFFDIAGHTPKMLCMPAAANLFIRGDISSSNITYSYPLPQNRLIDFLVANNGGLWNLNNAIEKQADITYSLQGKTVVDLNNKTHSRNSIRNTSPSSEASPLAWDLQDNTKKYVLIQSPKTKGFIGFHDKDVYDLHDGVTLEIGETEQGWANILLTLMQSSDAGDHWLLTATGYSENDGMKWKDEKKNSVGRNWGEGPPRVEPIPLQLSLPSFSREKVVAYPLDETGNRMSNTGIPFIKMGSQYVLHLNQKQTSLWYEIAATKTP